MNASKFSYALIDTNVLVDFNYSNGLTSTTWNSSVVALTAASGLHTDTINNFNGVVAGAVLALIDGQSASRGTSFLGSFQPPGVAPTIDGAVAGQATTSEAPVTPFSGVTIVDANADATDTLTITVGGSGGTLAGLGLTANGGGVYTLSDIAATVTTELDGLTFAPAAGQANTTSTTTFSLSDQSTAYPTATADSTTTVIDTDPAVAPTIGGAVADQATTSEAPVTPFSGVTIADANAGATDTLTITVAGSGGTLAGAGLTTNGGGVYTLSDTAATVTSELDALTFTPAAGQADTSSTTTFSLSDQSTAYPTATADSTTTVIDTDPAVAPTIGGAVADQATTSEAPVTPFSGLTIADANAGATDTLTITVAGSGGALAGAGLTTNGGGVYTLSDTAATVTSELDALTFTPAAGQADTSSTSTFSLNDLSSAYPVATMDTTTTVIDTDPAVAPTITGTLAGQATTSEAPVTPFSGLTIADANAGATDTLTITVAGSGGTLAGAGLTTNGGGVYTLSDTAATVTSELDALTFTPAAGQADTSSTSTFSLNDLSSAYPVATIDAKTTVTDTDPAIAPTISGTAQEGQRLTALAMGRAGAVTFQWFSSADNYITAIGDGPTYTVKEGDEGRTIAVVATAKNTSGATVSVASAPTTKVVDAAPTVTKPIITGSAVQDNTLTASATSGQSDNPVTYQWLEGKTNAGPYVAIANATGPTFLCTEAVETDHIEVIASVTNDNGVTISATSSATLPIVDPPPALTTPTISGVTQVGGILTATEKANDDDVIVLYQWRGSTDGGLSWNNIGAPTNVVTLKVTEALVGATLDVVATDKQLVSLSAISAMTSVVLDAAPQITRPTITGTARVGYSLTAKASVGKSDDAVSYQWLENRGPRGLYQALSGATGSSYAVTAGDKGFRIEVIATATNKNGATISATSGASAVVGSAHVTGPATNLAPISLFGQFAAAGFTGATGLADLGAAVGVTRGNQAASALIFASH